MKKAIVASSFLVSAYVLTSLFVNSALNGLTETKKVSIKPFVKLLTNIESINIDIKKDNKSKRLNLAQVSLEERLDSSINFAFKKYYAPKVLVKSVKKVSKIKSYNKAKILNEFELNSKSPIVLKRFNAVKSNVMEIKWASYFNDKRLQNIYAGIKVKEDIKVNLVSKNKTVIQEVSLTQSGVRKINEKNFTNDEKIDLAAIINQAKINKDKRAVENKTSQSDELVLIDYVNDTMDTVNVGKEAKTPETKRDTVAVTKSDDKKISSNVYNAYKRELNKTNGKNSLDVALADYSLALKNADKAKGKVSTQNAPKKNPAVTNPYLMAMKAMNTQSVENGNSNLSLKIVDTHILSGEGDDHYGFDFVFDYDKNEIITDEGDGEIVINTDLNNDVSVLRGTIIKKNKIRTKIDLAFEKGNFEFFVPLVDQESMIKLLDKLEIEGIGGFVLSDLTEEVEDVDLDGDYEQKIYLNEKFKMVKKTDDFRFILFLGVAPGNRLIQYLTFNNEVVQKVVHVVEDEIYYDLINLQRSMHDKLELHEKKPLAKKVNELDIDANDIKFFNTEVKAKKDGLNFYQISIPKRANNFRKYLEFKHLKESIFIGYEDIQKIEIPSTDYIEYIMSSIEVDTLDQRCLLQVNIDPTKTLTDFLIDGDTHKGPMTYDKFFLDKEGEFSIDEALNSDKIFVLGEGQGVFNAKLIYSDKSVDYIQSFCSRDTFLVEQL